MAIQTKAFNHGRIRRAEYDSASGLLQLHWDHGQAKAYKGVPLEVYRRLCAAPNPTTYWEDRIAEEYPHTAVVVTTPDSCETRKPPSTLADLFGGSTD
jgi:hypothetical protein